MADQVDVPEQLWEAVRAQALVWARTPQVMTMSRDLPRNARPSDRAESARTVPSLLQQLKAGFGAVFARPLLLGRNVPWMLQADIPWTGNDVPQDDLQSWSSAALAVEDAHRSTLAWLRSRLAGYPMLRAPQLAAKSHLTELGGFSLSNFWLKGETASALQYEPAPRQLAALLAVSPNDRALASELNQTARTVAAGLRASGAWITFDDVHEALTTGHRRQLAAAKRELAARLADGESDRDRLDIFEQDHSRRHLATQVIDTLDEVPREYCQAFDAAVALIDFAASEIFGQLTFYGDPTSIQVAEVDFEGDGLVQLAGNEPSNVLDIDAGGLVRVDDPLLPDALRVEVIRHRLSDTADTPLTITGRLLTGSAVWFTL